MKITIIGTGYVGLVTGACLADVGHEVLCVDLDRGKVDRLNRGEIPIHEPGLATIVLRNQSEGRLSFTPSPAEGAAYGEVLMIAVGTPPDEDGSADLRHVLAAATSIGEHLERYVVIVNKSTVPVGTGDLVEKAVAEALARRGSKVEFAVVSNPEFLKEGAAVEDFQKPDRIILGTSDQRAERIMRELYAPFQRNRDRVLVMSRRSAELTKYAANAMLATRISFMNEVAKVCELYGANVDQVRRAVASDSRIGSSFLFPGVGYGGSCFPKDVKAILRFSQDKDYEFKILKAVEDVNAEQKKKLLEMMRTQLGALDGKTIGVWGLAFKPRTDDMREAPAITIIEGLLAAGAIVRAYDPEARDTAERLFGDRITYCANAYDAVTGADALALVTEWNEFREPDFSRMKTLMAAPVIFDGRNIYKPEAIRAQGFAYHSIGR